MGQLTDEKRVQLWEAKKNGFSDVQIAHLLGISEEEVRQMRIENGILPVFKLVDTCAGEFEAYTPYYYSCYESPVLTVAEGTDPVPSHDSEIRKSDNPTIMILGGGANRIGQGIEFDYCCCHAAFALRDAGYDTVMVNSNPETVSTDYDTSTRLYFEPLTFENVMNIIEVEKPEGVIVQFGGQTPLNLATRLEEAGAPIIGTSPASIDRTEDRKSFGAFLDELGYRATRWRNRHQFRRSRRGCSVRSVSQFSFARVSCSADAPWRSFSMRNPLRNTSHARRRFPPANRS